MAMKLSVNGVPVDPADLVHARFRSVDPSPEELIYLAGFLIQAATDQMDQALSALERLRELGS